MLYSNSLDGADCRVCPGLLIYKPRCCGLSLKLIDLHLEFLEASRLNTSIIIIESPLIYIYKNITSSIGKYALLCMF